MALKDSITSLVNRAYFEKLFSHEFENAHRFKNELAVIMLDIDKFKSINGTYGHSAGDMVLKKFTRIIEGMVRKKGIFYRYRGN